MILCNLNESEIVLPKKSEKYNVQIGRHLQYGDVEEKVNCLNALGKDKYVIIEEENNIDFFDMKSGFLMGNNIVGLNKD